MNDSTDSHIQTMWVATVDEAASRKNIFMAKIEVKTLAENMNQFLAQVDQILATTPETVQKFQLVEFAVEAQISAKGQLVLLGAGGEVGGTGGIKFVFRKMPAVDKRTAPRARTRKT